MIDVGLATLYGPLDAKLDDGSGLIMFKLVFHQAECSHGHRASMSDVTIKANLQNGYKYIPIFCCSCVGPGDNE